LPVGVNAVRMILNVLFPILKDHSKSTSVLTKEEKMKPFLLKNISEEEIL
jgi:hypothetical protein